MGQMPTKTIKFAQECLATLAPPPKLTVSEWADENIYLPPDSPKPGKFDTDLTPYAREIQDAMGRGRHWKTVMMIGSQLIKTAAMLNYIGYRVACDPCRIKFVTYSKDEARKFTKDRIDKIAECSPALKNLLAETQNDPSNTTLRKEFPGGCITFVGANAPRDLASSSDEVVICDEVDGYPPSAGDEGDVLGLIEKRQSNFPNRRTIYGSTPKIKGESRIESEYENSTQEQWCVPCPSCGELQPYDWKRLMFNDGEGESGNPEMACRSCGCLHNEWEWKAGSDRGRWIARQEHPTTRGFHLNAMASPWLTWRELVQEFREATAKGPEVLKTFINTRLAETWEQPGDKISDDMLEERRHYYECDVPEGVNWLTCGVDVQKDRLEYEVVGWGEGCESWGVEYGVILGDPAERAVWNRLDALLERTYQREDGELLPIVCTAVDTGYATTTVYNYTKRRMSRNIWSIDGRGGPNKPLVAKPKKVDKNQDCWLFPVSTDGGKDLLFARLHVENGDAGYCHFPREEAFADGRPRGYNDAYFKGLFSEKRVPKRSGNQSWHIWKKPSSHTRNEPLDCRVYAYAAYIIRAPEITCPVKPKQTAAQPQAQATRPATAQPVRRSRRVSRGIQV